MSFPKILFYFFLFCNFPVFGQDLRQDKAFFEAQSTEIKEWLRLSNLDKVITFGKIDVQKEKIILKLNLPDEANWDNLDKKITSETENSLAEMLFRKMLFQFELKTQELEIELDGKDIIIILTAENTEVKTEKMQKMGSISDALIVPIEDLRLTNYATKRSAKDSIQAVKKSLKTSLANYLKKHEAKFEDYQFETVLDLPTQLVLEIRNITRAIVSEESYFEYIRLDFRFDKKGENLSIRYDIRAKYATGIIWAPRSTAYKDVDPKYADLFRRFCDRLKNHINQTLTNEK